MRYTYYYAVCSSNTIYRVCSNPKVCQFVVASDKSNKWKDSCANYLTEASLFTRVHRDTVRKQFPHLF